MEEIDMSVEEMFNIAVRLSRGDDNFRPEDKLKAKVVSAFLYVNEFSQRLKAMKALISIARKGNGSIQKAMGVLSSLFSEHMPEDLKTSLLDQQDRLESIKQTFKDPDEGLVLSLPYIVREILNPAEAISNEAKH